MKTKQDIRMTGNYQRKVSDFVNREVLTNANELIQALLTSDISEGEYSEELLRIRGFDNYESPMIYAIEQASNDQLAEYISWTDNEVITTSLELINHLTDDDIVEFSQYFDIEPEYTESLEFWVISSQFGEQLTANQENVIDILGLTIWGRTCSGQSISMDNVVCNIFDSIQ